MTTTEAPPDETRRPRPLDQRRAQLRRRLRRPHRGHPAEHRGDRARRPPRAPEDRRPLAADRLRVRAGRRGRRLHRVVLQGRPRRARAVRPRRRGLDPERGDQERGLLVRLRQQPRHRPADDDERVARPPRAEGAGRAGRRHLRHLRRHPRHGRQPDGRDGRARLPRLGLEVEGRHPDRVRARLPGPPRQHVRDDPLPALPGDRPGADDPARRGAAARRGCSAPRCTRAATGPATTSRATSPPSTARPSAS